VWRGRASTVRVIMVLVLVLGVARITAVKRRWGLDEGVTECGTHSVEPTGPGSPFQPSMPLTSRQYRPPVILTQCKNKVGIIFIVMMMLRQEYSRAGDLLNPSSHTTSKGRPKRGWSR